MTDHPRFRLINGDPDQRHRHYYGAPVVDFVLRLADWWFNDPHRRRDALRSATAHGDRPSPLRPVTASIFALSALLSGAPQPFAQETVRVRGVIEDVTGGDLYVVRTRDDRLLKLRLATNASVAASVKSSLSDIRPGLYIGIAAVPQADGVLRALEAHIFDESMRGTAEGHRAWDLTPRSTMTNAVVQDIVTAIDGHSVTLRYKDRRQQILLPAGTVVVTYLPGSSTELKRGAAIFVPAALLQPDGTLVAQRVMVGRDIAPPQ
jgi:hypothetical protein